MSSLTTSEPDPSGSVPPGSILFVGQDDAGHWLVQESHGWLEGRFVSFAAAMAFARAERHGFPGGTVAISRTPMIPQISFAPAAPFEMACAA